MDSSDRSALHEGLEQQQISVNKAGINATLKSRCSLLAAANPKYGRFDQHEKYSQQIDLEPALLSRFDIMFIITDVPDKEKDKELAEHIVQTNYAGEVYTHQQKNSTSNFSESEVEKATQEVKSAIDPDLMRKYIAYAKRNVFPTMTEDAKNVIEDFYVDLRSEGLDEGSAVPVTARKLEALVRLAEASARMRLSDHVKKEDAEKAVDIVMASLKDVGIDPETGEFDADIVETGTSKTQRDRAKTLLTIIEELQEEYEDEPGAPLEAIIDRAEEAGIDESKVEHRISDFKKKGDLYEPQNGYLRHI
jgi:replicative DNA helicase Mcm